MAKMRDIKEFVPTIAGFRIYKKKGSKYFQKDTSHIDKIGSNDKEIKDTEIRETELTTATEAESK